MSKICTSIEQSEKLIELGIDVNTADMWYGVTYKKIGREDDDFGESIEYTELSKYPDIKENAYTKEGIPSWSLSALLDLMPKLYEFENDPDDGGCQPNLCKGWDNNQWHIVYRSSIYITEWYDNPIDAAFEMVCWLKENGKI